MMITVASSISAHSSSLTNDLDKDILELVSLVENGHIDLANSLSDRLVDLYPGSMAIKLIYADLQNVLANRTVSMDPHENFSRQLLEVLDELKARKKHALLNQDREKIPDNILFAHSETRHIIAVDMSLSRMYLLERKSNSVDFSIAEHHYVSIGRGGIGKVDEGDLKTPVGIYRIDGFREDRNLPELYGFGAFTLDFPNEIDRKSGFSGHGIWLHGVPHHQLNRPPLTSEGCVVMRNDLIEHLLGKIDRDTTPVILAKSLSWISPQESLGLTKSLIEAITIANNLPTPTESETSQEHELTVATRGLKGLFDDLINPPLLTPAGLEILRYPEHPQSRSGQSVFRVSFLQSNNSKSDSEPTFVTQYWQLQTDGTWQLVLDNSTL